MGTVVVAGSRGGKRKLAQAAIDPSRASVYSNASGIVIPDTIKSSWIDDTDKEEIYYITNQLIESFHYKHQAPLMVLPSVTFSCEGFQFFLINKKWTGI